MSETKRSTSSQNEATRQAVLVVQNITINAFLFLALGIYLAITTRSWQAYQFIILSTMVAITGFVSIALIRRGRLTLGTWLFFIADLVAPIWAALLVSDLGFVALAYILVTSYFMITFAIPKETRYSAMALAAVGLIISLSVEVIDPNWRLVSELMLIVSPILTGLLAVIFIGVISWQMWNSGQLRYKIIVMTIGVLTPVLVVSTFITAQQQQRQLESLLIERAEASALVGAAAIGRSFEDAISSGVIGSFQAFDQDYDLFLEFEPSMDPAYDPEKDGDPTIYNKYHTSYDDYTDENWTTLLDSFLVGPDILYAIPVDVNGYLPTHNTRYTTGDLSIANDRTKRIFDDPVGIKAARNTEQTLQQVYHRPGTDEILWDVSAPIYVNGQHWGAFRVGVQLGENQSRVVATTIRSIIASTVVVVVLIGFAWFLGRYISEPIERLTGVASQAAAGDLDQQIEIQNRDEITILAQAFTSMIAQLSDLVTSLEQRVNERTRALETSTEVGRRLSTILDQRALIREVVEQIQTAFNYYYAQIYLFDEDKENLVMVGGTGEAGQIMFERGHSVPKGRGLVGQAADTSSPVLVSNVERSIGYEIITAETVAEVFERESTPESTTTWYNNLISKNFTNIQDFAERVEQMKASGGQVPRLGYILYGLNDFMGIIKTGAEEAARSLGIEVEIVSADFDNDRGVRLFREMIAEKKDGLIVTPLLAEKWVTPIQEAVEAGIPVLTANLRCSGAPVSATFVQDSYQSGRILARELQKTLTALGRTSGEIVVASDRGVHELQERYAGLKQGLQASAYTLSELYNVPLDDEQQNLAGWEQLVEDNPDMVAAVGLASVDLPSLIRIKKRTNAPWAAAGYDITVEVLDAIRDGIAQVTIGQHPYMQGYLPILALGQHFIDDTPLNGWIVDSWQSNPLLPLTQAEAVVPIAVGENVLGVLDVQDSQIEGLSEEDVDLLQSIANQVAVALQNAQAYQRTQQQVAREALIANINQQIQSTTDIEEALQVAIRELGRAIDADTSVRLTNKSNG